MTQAVKVTVNQSAIDALCAGLVDDLQAPARPAAQAMVQVFYDRIQLNVRGIRRKTGNLAASIYQAYSPDNSGPGRATYHTSWNARKAPHGHLVEFGHLQRYEISFDPQTQRFTTHKDRPLATPKHVAARPFVRPAMALAQQAMDAGEKRYFEELQKAGVTK